LGQPLDQAADTVQLQQRQDLRFYLETTDAIRDAPSIGPRTAERLYQIGVQSVGDLLGAEPDTMAARLDDRRTSAETIRIWQTQARLVCRVPNLRGHDAQILVACGITEPRVLSEQLPRALHKRVRRFLSTAAGKRLGRNRKAVELAEVAAWIEWGASARQLRAA
jgi:nucleotidyltransferase/DNA polymerase involved in DNA repair